MSYSAESCRVLPADKGFSALLFNCTSYLHALVACGIDVAKKKHIHAQIQDSIASFKMLSLTTRAESSIV
jgi:hypothetical protein